MIASYNRKSLMIGLPGLVLQIGCYAMAVFVSKNSAKGSAAADSLALVFALGSLVGLVLLIIGLGYYAKAKGYSAVLGLLGLLSCIGLLILAVLPDKTKGQDGSTT